MVQTDPLDPLERPASCLGIDKTLRGGQLPPGADPSPPAMQGKPVPVPVEPQFIERIAVFTGNNAPEICFLNDDHS